MELGVCFELRQTEVRLILGWKPIGIALDLNGGDLRHAVRLYHSYLFCCTSDKKLYKLKATTCLQKYSKVDNDARI